MKRVDYEDTRVWRSQFRTRNVQRPIESAEKSPDTDDFTNDLGAPSKPTRPQRLFDWLGNLLRPIARQ